jgi:outer membrane receptor for monomeric catechols
MPLTVLVCQGGCQQAAVLLSLPGIRLLGAGEGGRGRGDSITV